MNEKQQKIWKRIQKVLPVFFLIYGLGSVFTLERDFVHVTKLGIFLLLLGPSFLLLVLLGRIFERLSDHPKWSKYGFWVNYLNVTATQTLTQYVLIFCLPFFIAKQNWIYFGLTAAWLATTLWDPLYEKLVQSAFYRHMLLAWSLMTALSFLYPFVWPNQLPHFYLALATVCTLAMIPTRREWFYLLTLIGAWGLLVGSLLVLPPAYKFPILSVWSKAPRFAWDADNKDLPPPSLGKEMTQADIRLFIDEGHTLCCVAPIIAPPSLNINIIQEWTLGDRVIETAQLKTPIHGSAKQQAFHSFFCKKNFPFGQEDERLRCRIRIGDDIDLGGASLEVMKVKTAREGHQVHERF